MRPHRSDADVVFDPDTYQRDMPWQALARLREREAVTWIEERAVDDWPAGPGFWAVWRHTDVKAVLKRPKLFSSHLGATQIRDPATPDALGYVRKMMLNLDPPEHSRIRGLLTRSFTPRTVAKLATGIRDRARVLVDRAADAAEVNFTEVAADLPVSTLADILGVPDSDKYLLYDWANRVIGYQDSEYAVSDTVDRAATTSMAKAALAVRPTPGPDGRMPDPRTRRGIPDLYAYAHELARHKRRHPSDGVMSIPGDKVVVYFASANRDPRAFPDPDRFQIARPHNDHLAFGHGPHFCLGAYLARSQMQAMFAAVLDRFVDVEFAGEVTRLRSNFQNGLKRLPIRWRSR